MSAKFRYWCGECAHKTPWLDEGEGAERLAEHYRRRHPGVEPGGDFEIRSDAQPGGCLGGVARMFLWLLG